MKHVKLYEEFINEATTDGTLKSLVGVLNMSKKMGIFDDEMLSEVKQEFIDGVYGTFKHEFKDVSDEKKQLLDSYFNQMVKPLEKAKTLGQFIAGIDAIDHIKSRIKELSLVDEGLDAMITWAKDTLKKGKDWWDNNKHSVAVEMGKFLAELIIHILMAILTGKSDSNIKFGGGRFGGGGAKGKY